MRVRRFVFAGFVAVSLACASVPPPQPLAVSPLTAGPGEGVVVDQALLLIDVSGSVSRRKVFPQEKVLVEGFVAGMPDGSYDAGTVAFGGLRRDKQPMGPFDRAALASHASQLPYLGEGTPIHTVLEESQASLAGRGGRGAVFLITDGKPTDVAGRDVEPGVVLDAARALAASHGGELCYHTIQLGDDPGGAAFLKQLAGTTRCGSSRSAASLDSGATMTAFQGGAFLGAAPAPVVAAATPADSDGDGVIDRRDECPGTPRGAVVDERGCWVLDWLQFGNDSAVVAPDVKRRLKSEVVPVIEANPELRLRIEGHTDSRGAAAYNQALSERRAEAVREVLVEAGVAPNRIEARGFGASKPVADNDTREGRARNRRTELTVLR